MSSADEPDNRTPDQIRADIVAHREELATTVEALRYKLDVKARAGEKLSPYKVHAAVGAAVLVGLIVLNKLRTSRKH